jgi:ABC-type xylose transport system permease subunit
MKRYEPVLLYGLVGAIAGVVAMTYQPQPRWLIVVATAVIGAVIGFALAVMRR